MSLTRFTNTLAFDRDLKVGQRVRVYWGYGLGFRVNAAGTVTKLFPQSVRVRLDEDVPDPADSSRVGWPAGFELHQIPRFMNRKWVGWENGVEPLEGVLR